LLDWSLHATGQRIADTARLIADHEGGDVILTGTVGLFPVARHLDAERSVRRGDDPIGNPDRAG
jgi:hypothetical protein